MTMLTRFAMCLGFMTLAAGFSPLVANGKDSMADERGSAYERQLLEGIEKLKAGERPMLCDDVVDRLDRGIYVADRALLRCMEAFINLEEASARARPGLSPNHSASIAYIDRVAEASSDRSVLRSALLRRKSQLILAESGDRKRAIPLLQSAYESIEAERLKIDRQRNAILVEMGFEYLNADLVAEAESSFLRVLAYPWYSVENRPEDLQSLRSLYVLAGRGLIRLRSGDANKLSSIVFVPAAMEELGPELRRALASVKQ